MMSAPWQRVLDFWFDGATSSPQALERRTEIWFGNDAGEQQAFDDAIRRQFGADVDAALRDELDSWAPDAHGRLALILLLDQFTRNIFRGTGRAFSGDAAALQLVLDGMTLGADLRLEPLERMFFCMPLEHAEDAGVQNRGVEAFQRLAANAPPHLRALLGGCVHFARAHRDIVVRFGRFPHRNAALGRASTPAEREYLAGDAPDFGQSAARID